MLHKYNTTTEAKRVFLSIAADRYYKWGLGVAEFLAAMKKLDYRDEAIFNAFNEAVGRARYVS